MRKLKKISGLLVVVICCCAVLAHAQQQTKTIWPALDIEVKKNTHVEAKVKDILEGMTLPQKIAQMIQPEIRSISVEEMRQYGFGSYLNGGGAFPNNNKHATVSDWIQLAEAMYQASIDDSLDGSTIPTMWGTDAVHGHNNVIGATLFPHNIGLGATRNPDLIEKIAEITATEVMATGIDWVFAPTVATVRDDRWGRTYEGYSEDPEIVKQYAEAIVKGLQGHADKDFLGDNRVISTVKHFVGDGGTEQGIDQGNNITDEQTLFDIHAQGYVGGLTAGAQSVMASFNSWHGKKIHGSHYLLTEVLKNQMGFDGFVVGDWSGHGQIKGCDNTRCAQAANAGLDIYMAPSDWKALYHNTLAQAEQGIIPLSRVDDAVTRILRVKVRAGLFDKPNPAQRKFSGKANLVGATKHRDIARLAVRESLVLLKNKNGLLPLNPTLNILVAGDGADNIGKQSGGWTITWQGTGNTNKDFPGGKSIYAGIREQVERAGGKAELSVEGSYQQKPDVAIVVFGEEPYAEGQGDRETLEYQPNNKLDLALLKKFKQQGIPVVSVFLSGRPMWVNPELNASDAFVAAWLPGSEGLGIAEVILAKKDGSVQRDFTGKLSFSWPKEPNQMVNRHDEHYAPLLPYGFGLQYGDKNILPDNLPEDVVDLGSNKSQVDIFSGTLQKPLYMQLFSANEQVLVNSNSHKVGGLSYRTVDRVVQEDARRLTLKGNQQSGFRIASSQNILPEVSAAIADKGVLKVDVNVIQKPDSPVYIKMRCQKDNTPKPCETSVEVSSWLNKASLGEWSELVVNLQCFENQGMNFDKTSVPFELVTEGVLDIKFSNIQFVSVWQGEQGYQCP